MQDDMTTIARTQFVILLLLVAGTMMNVIATCAAVVCIFITPLFPSSFKSSAPQKELTILLNRILFSKEMWIQST